MKVPVESVGSGRKWLTRPKSYPWALAFQDMFDDDVTIGPSAAVPIRDRGVFHFTT